MNTATTKFTDNSTQTSTYTYDGEGKRVRRNVNTAETWQVYGIGGEPSKERDDETGVDYFGARYFASTQGRFTSPDPLMIHDDRLEEPQRLNLYEYCRNNPLRFIDPNALDDITYDQAGKEIERKDHHGRLWHVFNSDTWHMRANDGTTYNLDSPLRQLPSGQNYNVINKDQTWQLLTHFVNENRMRPGERPH